MQVSITGRHIDLTEALKNHVHDKLQHLKHSFDQMVDVQVVLSVEKIRQRCEITIHASGVTIHASEETDDMYASIDGAVDKLNRQLKRYRQKLKRHQSQHRKREGREVKVAHMLFRPAGEEELPEDHTPEPVARQEIAAKPMSLDEAIMQLDLSGQDELVFTNQETDRLNVLYRKADGSVACIEAEAA